MNASFFVANLESGLSVLREVFFFREAGLQRPQIVAIRIDRTESVAIFSWSSSGLSIRRKLLDKHGHAQSNWETQNVHGDAAACV